MQWYQRRIHGQPQQQQLPQKQPPQQFLPPQLQARPLPVQQQQQQRQSQRTQAHQSAPGLDNDPPLDTMSGPILTTMAGPAWLRMVTATTSGSASGSPLQTSLSPISTGAQMV